MRGKDTSSVRPGPQVPVDVLRAAPAQRIVPDRDPVGREVGGVAAQRILPRQPVRQREVDVRARLPRRQGPFVAAQHQRDDVVGDALDALQHRFLHGQYNFR